MAESDPNLTLGRLAIHFKLLSKDQVTEALVRWRESGEVVDFGVFLASEEILPTKMVKKLLSARQQYFEREQAKESSQAPAAPEPIAPEPAASEPVLLVADEPDDVLTFDPTTTDASPVPAAPVPAAPVPVAPPVIAAPPPSAPPVIAAPPPSAPIAPPVPLIESPAETPLAQPQRTPDLAPEQSAPAPAAEAVPASVDDSGLRTPIDRTPPTAEELAVAFETHSQFRLQLGAGTTLLDLLRQTRELGGSDLHLHSGSRLKVRLNGTLIDTSGLVAPAVATQLIVGMLSEEQLQEIETRQQVDFSYEIPTVGRFRANAYLQQRGLDVVFRAISPEPPNLADLGLPEALSSLTSYHQGLVLFTGPAGCGKSTTMAAMVRLINEARPDHIITVEDPIEYVHRSQRCIVNQRQVGPHTGSFARALRGALREDPDIIVIGELRDLETISLALTAAETGHLVLGTLHTSSAIRTINRLLGVFPPDQQAQIRVMVSESLRGVVSQRLVRRADGQGRVAALEVMINNKAVGNLIRENKTFQIHSAIQTGSRQGMCLLDTSLLKLLKDGVITVEDARAQAENPDSFK